MLTHTRTLPPYAHPALTPYSGAGAKAWGEYMQQRKIETLRAQAFLKESDPWGTGFDHVGVKSSAGVKQVAQLRNQLADLATVKSPKPTQPPPFTERTPTTEPTPKPRRGEKRDRFLDDDDDLDALDESPDSAERDPVSAATELATEVRAQVGAEMAKIMVAQVI
jgi:hypothetical protein